MHTSPDVKNAMTNRDETNQLAPPTGFGVATKRESNPPSSARVVSSAFIAKLVR